MNYEQKLTAVGPSKGMKWRRFNFFDKEQVKEVNTGSAFDKLKSINISASACGRGQLVFGDHDGNLHFVSRQMELSSFRAYEIRVSHLFQMKQHNILISVGEDEEGVNPLMKVWNLDKSDKSGSPLCSRIVRAIPGNQPTRVSCLTVHENLSLMAVGFDNGSVVLFRGDVTRERHSKQRVLYEGSGRVTGLAFRSQAKTTVLFVASSDQLVAISILAKDKDSKIILNHHGCAPLCAVLSDGSMDYQFVIGRQDAVYFYQPDGRGPCLAFEGNKLQLHWYRGYLVIVGRENKPWSGNVGSGVEMNSVTVYDIQNKFIAYSAPIPEVTGILCEWGSIYLLCSDCKLYHLQEKDTQTKLEILFKKNLYVQAISLAQSQQYDQDGVIEIFRQYGDHLYSKGDHDGAITQYIKTIGKLEASYVIRKFLDAQRIHNLTAYLQALHRAQLATEDHTTLLLNCYTKLKDVDKLDHFIMTKDNREVDFDVETAIRVLRLAGNFSHALFLADKHSQHEWYLKIQLEDNKDYSKALQYIAKLDFLEAEHNLKSYGKMLMSEAAQETTQLLKRLCTDYRPTDKPLIDASNLEGGLSSVQKANAEEFIHIFVNKSEELTEFLEHMVKVRPKSPPLVYNTLLELYLHDYVHEAEIAAKVDKERKTLDLLQNPNAGYDLDQALVLCQMNNFKAGILYLYEKAKLYQQILQYHLEHNEYVHIIEACKRFGMQDPNLWIQALAYFARKEENCKQQIVEVLGHIDKYNLLPPLLVVQTLAHNSTATLSVVKDYITRRLQAENDQIVEDERLIRQYREETKNTRTHIQELKTSAKIFQVSKCSVCSHPLDLPSVHFLCQHSFHQHCFESYSESEHECPVCQPQNRKISDQMRAKEDSKDLHGMFYNELERTQDGFSVVADYFGRGVFNQVTPLTESTPQPPPRRAHKYSTPPPENTGPSSGMPRSQITGQSGMRAGPQSQGTEQGRSRAGAQSQGPGQGRGRPGPQSQVNIQPGGQGLDRLGGKPAAPPRASTTTMSRQGARDLTGSPGRSIQDIPQPAALLSQSSLQQPTNSQRPSSANSRLDAASHRTAQPTNSSPTTRTKTSGPDPGHSPATRPKTGRPEPGPTPSTRPRTSRLEPTNPFDEVSNNPFEKESTNPFDEEDDAYLDDPTNPFSTDK